MLTDRPTAELEPVPETDEEDKEALLRASRLHWMIRYMKNLEKSTIIIVVGHVQIVVKLPHNLVLPCRNRYQGGNTNSDHIYPPTMTTPDHDQKRLVGLKFNR